MLLNVAVMNWTNSSLVISDYVTSGLLDFSSQAALNAGGDFACKLAC